MGSVINIKRDVGSILEKDAAFVLGSLRQNFLTGPAEDLTPDHVDKIMRGYMIGGAAMAYAGDSSVECTIEVTDTLDIVNVFAFTVATDKPSYVLEHFYKPLAAADPDGRGFDPDIVVEDNSISFVYRTSRFSDAELGEDALREALLALSADHRLRLSHADAKMREAESDVRNRDEILGEVIVRQRRRFDRATAARSMLDSMTTERGTIQVSVGG